MKYVPNLVGSCELQGISVRFISFVDFDCLCLGLFGGCPVVGLTAKQVQGVAV
jgi:hypothetical protein